MKPQTIRACVLIVSLALFPHNARAQFAQAIQLSPDVVLEQATSATISQLERAHEFFTKDEASDGLETLRRALDSEASSLVPVRGKSDDKNFAVYQPLALIGQRRLCELAEVSPKALALYRTQEDAAAKKLLADAQARHDEPLLHRIVSESLATSSGDNAALLAGDAALARGDVLTARMMWQRIHPALVVNERAAQELGVRPGIAWYWAVRGRDGDDIWNALRPHLEATDASGGYPDSDIPIADVRARLAIASFLEGNAKRAQWELQLLRRLHPDAKGKLAGRAGNWVALVEHFVKQQPAKPASVLSTNWPTFAGNNARNAVASFASPVKAEVAWKVDLPQLVGDRDLIGAGRFRVREDHRSLMSYEPIVVDNLAIYFDGRAVKAHHIESGELAWEVVLRPDGLPPVLSNQQVGVPRYTLTAADDLLAVTLTTASVPLRRAPTVRQEHLSRVVVLGLATRRILLDLATDDATEVFEGTPLVDRGRIYVSSRRVGEVRPQTFVSCYEVGTARRVWRQAIASADWLDQGIHASFANGLLTLVNETLFYNTNLGAIAALSARDGTIHWVTRYPRAESFPAPRPERSERHFFRDLTPCLVYQGQVICAPADCERIFALDATSGEVLWSLPPGDAVDVTQLLGARDGYLLASGDYLYWIDLAIGQVATQFPAALPSGPGLALPAKRGWGRGFVTESEVLFPTQNAIYRFALAPEKSDSIYRPIAKSEFDLRELGLTGGNVVPVHGGLIIASGERLAFVRFGKD